MAAPLAHPMAAMAQNMPPPVMGLQHPLTGSGEVSVPASGDPLLSRKKDDRLPQWGFHETREFIIIRGELEKDFVSSKRNKNLWELIAAKMKERGFRRTADQCKCKWKNLVNRYKGKDVPEAEQGRQCHFFDEMDTIFKERAKNMDRLLSEPDVGGSQPKKKVKRGPGRPRKYEPSDDETEDDDEDDDDEEDDKKKKRGKLVDPRKYKVTAEKQRASSMQDVLEDFFKQQQRLEAEWREVLDQREGERRAREAEWRDAIQKLELERLAREAAWREREEQRHAGEELRAQKREELFAALITQLVHSQNQQMEMQNNETNLE